MKKKLNKVKNIKSGFTLLELLVVVLIIGILAAIALPQYRMAVTKSRVASILPLMRRWKDSMAEWKLQHGDYWKDSVIGTVPNADDLGVNWPSDWECSLEGRECWNDYWRDCMVNEEATGYVYCYRDINDDNSFYIVMYQSDDEFYENVRGMMTCESYGTEAERICKGLGGKLLEGLTGLSGGPVYKLN